METKPFVAGKLARFTASVRKAAKVMLVVVNVVIVLPSAVFGVLAGRYAAALVVIALNLVGWAVACGGTRLVCTCRRPNESERT